MFAAQIRIEAECHVYIYIYIYVLFLAMRKCFANDALKAENVLPGTTHWFFALKLSALWLCWILKTKGILLSTTQNNQEELNTSAGILLQTSWPSEKKKQNLST